MQMQIQIQQQQKASIGRPFVRAVGAKILRKMHRNTFTVEPTLQTVVKESAQKQEIHFGPFCTNLGLRESPLTEYVLKLKFCLHFFKLAPDQKA